MDSTAGRFPIAYPAPQGALAPWAQLLERAGRFILGVVARHAEARRARATLRELQSLNARQLEDIGLTRADIDLMTLSTPGAWHAQRDRVPYV